MALEIRDINILKDKLKIAFKNVTFSRDDFNIYIKERIAEEIEMLMIYTLF